MIQRLIEKIKDLAAVQYNEDNLDTVLLFSSDVVYNDKLETLILNNNVMINKSDWIVHDYDHYIKVYDEEFNSRYEITDHHQNSVVSIRNKPSTLDGIMYTGNNIDEIKEFVGNNYSAPNFIHTKYGPHELSESDWVVKNNDDIDVLDNETVIKDYTDDNTKEYRPIKNSICSSNLSTKDGIFIKWNHLEIHLNTLFDTVRIDTNWKHLFYEKMPEVYIEYKDEKGKVYKRITLKNVTFTSIFRRSFFSINGDPLVTTSLEYIADSENSEYL